MAGTEPPLVQRATASAAAAGFGRSCDPCTGRFLHLLAAQRGRARVGEIGTGHGVGAAWMVSALPPGVPFVTVELDASRAAGAARLFAGDEDVTVVCGDWHEALPPHAPFDLLFYDGGGKQRPDADGDEVFGLLAPGGTLVMDDLTPGRPVAGDPVREHWLAHPDLTAVEAAVSDDQAVIVGVRVR